MPIDLNAYVAGGYFLVRSVTRDADRSPDLLPERLLSLSRCICPAVEIVWGWNGQEQVHALDFGVPEHKLADLRAWSTSETVDFPNVFLTLAAARQFAEDFLPEQEHLHLLGIGLPVGLINDFLRHKQTVYDAHLGQSREIIYGVSYMAKQRQPLPPGGQSLGYEVLSYDMNINCSWLCNGIERDMADQFGICPNQHGLIATHDEALQVYAWIAEDEQRGTRAEPEPYYPWLVVDYPLTETES
jgi:hypothetical protein